MTNLPAQLSTSQTEISNLTEKLAPINDANVAEAMKSLLAAGMMLSASISPEKAPAVYAFALKDVSAHALKRVVTKLIRGEYEINRAFIPLPPDFSVMARNETQKIIDDLARARSIEEARLARDARPVSYSKAPILNDLRVNHRVRSEELEGHGYVLYANCKGHDDFNRMAKRREVPVGSIYLWAIDEVWSPRVQPRQEQPEYQEAAE